MSPRDLPHFIISDAMKTPAGIVCACYRAYETKDRAALEILLAPDFTFTSPLDDNISRDTYFSRCWPNSQTLNRFEIEKLPRRWSLRPISGLPQR